MSATDYRRTPGDEAYSAMFAAMMAEVTDACQALLAFDDAVGGRLLAVELLTGQQRNDEDEYAPEEDTFKVYAAALDALMAAAPSSHRSLIALDENVGQRLREAVDRCLDDDVEAR